MEHVVYIDSTYQTIFWILAQTGHGQRSCYPCDVCVLNVMLIAVILTAEIHDSAPFSVIWFFVSIHFTSFTVTTQYLQQSRDRRAPAGWKLWGWSLSLHRWMVDCSDKCWCKRCLLAGDQTRGTPHDARCWPEVHFSFALWKQNVIKTWNLGSTVFCESFILTNHNFELKLERDGYVLYLLWIMVSREEVATCHFGKISSEKSTEKAEETGHE